MPFLPPNQQRQSTEGSKNYKNTLVYYREFAETGFLLCYGAHEKYFGIL